MGGACMRHPVLVCLQPASITNLESLDWHFKVCIYPGRTSTYAVCGTPSEFTVDTELAYTRKSLTTQ